MPFVTVKRPFAARRRLSRRAGLSDFAPHFPIFAPFRRTPAAFKQAGAFCPLFFIYREGKPGGLPPSRKNDLCLLHTSAQMRRRIFSCAQVWRNASSHIRADAAENAAAVLRRRYRSAAMLLRRAPMAFFSSRDTCACEMPTSPEISVCVLPSK